MSSEQRVHAQITITKLVAFGLAWSMIIGPHVDGPIRRGMTLWTTNEIARLVLL